MNPPNLTNKQLSELDSLFELLVNVKQKILEILAPAIKQMDHY